MTPRPILLRWLALVLALLGVAVQAQPLRLPVGLTIDPDPSIDLTYQVVPQHDETQKVLAGWSGETLLYMVVLEKLPPGWLDARKYFAALVGDLRAGGYTVEIGRRGTYAAGGSLNGSLIELRLLSKGQSPTAQVAHFLTDGKVAFLAIATAIDASDAERTLAESAGIFQSASLSTGPAATGAGQPEAVNETPYVGVWRADTTGPEDRPMVARMELRADLSFATEVDLSGVCVFSAVGAWSVGGGRMRWTYLRSVPPLPDDKKSEEDAIVSFDGDRLVLRGVASGRESVFVRQSPSAATR